MADMDTGRPPFVAQILDIIHEMESIASDLEGLSEALMHLDQALLTSPQCNVFITLHEMVKEKTAELFPLIETLCERGRAV